MLCLYASVGAVQLRWQLTLSVLGEVAVVLVWLLAVISMNLVVDRTLVIADNNQRHDRDQKLIKAVVSLLKLNHHIVMDHNFEHCIVSKQ